MRYSKVFLESFGYEIAPVVVSSTELEARLAPVYDALHLSPGQLEALTGIIERRWWEEGYRLSDGAVVAARRALEAADVRPGQVEALIYGGVCREHFEPATACRVASDLGISPEAAVYDISNACLGVLNGIVEIANRIELGQIRAGLVVACETAREINDIMIERMCQDRSMDFFKLSLATLTGGSGAVAVLLTDGSFSRERRRRLLGGVTQTAPQFHGLCRWGIEALRPLAPHQFPSVHLDRLGRCADPWGRAWHPDLAGLPQEAGLGQGPDRQGDLPPGWRIAPRHDPPALWESTLEKDFSTFPYLGNIGTVSLPLTAALAEDREVLHAGDHVAFLGIGSGLNCLMLGVQW